jgi:hypothetical protein
MQDDLNTRIIRDKTQLTSTREPKTPLQALIDTTILGFYEQDAIAGNGGVEVVREMTDFLARPQAPPRLDFASFDEFLKYRVDDAAMPFVFPFFLREVLNDRVLY